MKFGYWEVDLAKWLNKLLGKLGNPADVLYIDLGANLGIHSLHAAKANCTVWSVEPQEKNLHKVICVIATFIVPETYFMLPIYQCPQNHSSKCLSSTPIFIQNVK